MIRVITAALLSLAVVAAPATATPPGVAHVRTADLDFSNPRDVARLRSRVAQAVKSVCDNADNVFPEESKEIDACERTTRVVADRLASAVIAARGYRVASR